MARKKSTTFILAIVIYLLLASICIMAYWSRETPTSFDFALGHGLWLAAEIYLVGMVYFLPTIIASTNHKKNAKAIYTLNLLLGWTFLGWVVAAVWASMKD